MFNRKAKQADPWAQIAAQVDSESRPYTDPKARYPLAEQARRAQREGAERRGQR